MERCEVRLPSWLTDVECVRPEALSLRDALGGSVYYPACGRDGDPVRFLGNAYQSFIFIDYGLTEMEVRRSLRGTHGFRGYRVLGICNLSWQDLAPTGWHPAAPEPGDGEPWRAKIVGPDYALWAVLERRQGFSEDHGPERLSLLLLHACGAAAYSALYVANKASAAVLCVIYPGTGFGGNWTVFPAPGRLLHRSVMDNPYGQPQYVMHHANEPPWPEYSRLVRVLRDDKHEKLGLWARERQDAVLNRGAEFNDSRPGKALAGGNSPVDGSARCP